MRRILPVLLLALIACERADQAAGPVATSAPEAPQPTAPATATTWRALGTEPFWSADLAGATALYRTPDVQQGQRAEVVRETRADGGVRATGMLGGAPFALEIAAGKCSDGMSDRSYDWRAALTIGSSHVTGCAYRGELPPSEPRP